MGGRAFLVRFRPLPALELFPFRKIKKSEFRQSLGDGKNFVFRQSFSILFICVSTCSIHNQPLFYSICTYIMYVFLFIYNPILSTSHSKSVVLCLQGSQKASSAVVQLLISGGLPPASASRVHRALHHQQSGSPDKHQQDQRRAPQQPGRAVSTEAGVPPRVLLSGPGIRESEESAGGHRLCQEASLLRSCLPCQTRGLQVHSTGEHPQPQHPRCQQNTQLPGGQQTK